MLGPIVDANADTCRPQLIGHAGGGLEHLSVIVLAGDRHDHDLLRGHAGWQSQPPVVAVRHHDAADQPRGRTPRGRIGVLLAAVAAGVADAERACEALAQIVRGCCLERFSVPHQRFERVGVDGAGEPLALALAAPQHRDRQDVLDRVGVDVLQDRQRLGDRLFFGLVRRVPLLPEELARPKEEARPQLPADDVGPLVVEQRQVAVGPYPAGVRRPNHRLGGGTHRERLLQLLPAGLGDDGDLGREPFDELSLLSEHRDGHQQWEVEVLVTGRLDPVVELALDCFPDRVAVRLDHHRAANGRVLGQAGAAHYLAVPGGEVARLGWQRVVLIGTLPRAGVSRTSRSPSWTSTGGYGVRCGAPGRNGGSAYAGTCTYGGCGATAGNGRSSSTRGRSNVMRRG